MPTIRKQDNTLSLTIPVDQALIITAPVGSSVLVSDVYDLIPAGSVSGQTSIFGPFSSLQTVRVSCSEGSASWDLVRIANNYAPIAFGWRDLTAPVDVRGIGLNDPAYAVYAGTTMRAYQFSASTMNEVFFVFHVPHDFVPGTDIYFHAHWSNAEAVPNTGNVVWKFDYQFAKGFGQESFPAIKTETVIAPCPAVRYMHNVSETAAVRIASMEVDGLILVRGYRDADNALDTCQDAIFLHTMDIHYQSTNTSTKNKAPGFYL